MKIQYLGHACFRLISDMGTTIVCDPYNSEMVGFSMPHVRCDIVTVSHHHDDHDCLDSIIGAPAVIDVAGECCADDVAITSIATYHDDVRGKKRGNNLVFCFSIDGLKVVHMGDIGCVDDNVLKAIENCDVLLIPVGGTFTVNASEAKKYVDAARPKIVVPMHYKSEQHAFDIDGADKFLSLFNADNVELSAGDTITLCDVPQNETPRIILLQRFDD